MNRITTIACRAIGVAGMAIACHDAIKVSKQFAEIGSDHKQEHYLEKAYYNTRTLDKVSYSDNLLREKCFELHSRNPIPSIFGKIEGWFKGLMYGLANKLPLIAFSSMAILGKNFWAKLGVVGTCAAALYKILREGLGVGKNNPMH